MLFRLSRILFWLAAIAAVTALVGPASLATPLTALAGLALLAAYASARWALQRARHGAPSRRASRRPCSTTALGHPGARAGRAVGRRAGHRAWPRWPPRPCCAPSWVRARPACTACAPLPRHSRIWSRWPPTAAPASRTVCGSSARRSAWPCATAAPRGGEGGSWAIALPGSDGTAALIELGAPPCRRRRGARGLVRRGRPAGLCRDDDGA